MKHLYSTLFLLLLFSSAYAQQDFRKGYIVQNSDTLRGYVDYRGDKRSAQTTAFKRTLDSAEQLFTPDDIDGYGFYAENKVFESKIVPATKPDTESQNLFLNALIKGKASIYYYLDADQGEHYYLAMNNGDLIELLQQEYLQKDPTTGKTYEVTSKVFAGTLGNAFSDCNKLTEAQFKKLSLTNNSLINITRKYNMCVEPGGMAHEQKRESLKVTFGPVVTLSLSNHKFSGDNYLDGLTLKDETVRFGGGLSLNASLPKMNEKLSFQVDLLYVPSQYSKLVTKEENNSSTITYETTFDLAYLKLPVQLRYTYPRGQLRPYFNAGIMAGYAIKDKNQVTRTTTLGGNTSNPKTYPAIPGSDTVDGFRKLTEGLTAGAGLIYPLHNNFLSLEARYEITNGMSAISSFGSSVSTLYFMAAYGF